MDTEQCFLVYEHPIDGSMSWAQVGDAIRFSCRWPADLSTDEWIGISNEFDHGAYVREVSRLREAGRCRIEGRRSGYMGLAVVSPHRIRLDVLDQEAIRPTSLLMTLALAIEDLLPGKEPKRREHRRQ